MEMVRNIRQREPGQYRSTDTKISQALVFCDLHFSFSKMTQYVDILKVNYKGKYPAESEMHRIGSLHDNVI